MIDPRNGNRNYSPSVKQVVEPKSLHPPPEAQHSIEIELLSCSEDEFIERLQDWMLAPYTYGHLNHKEMIRLFERVDTVLVRLIEELKSKREIRNAGSNNFAQNMMDLEIPESERNLVEQQAEELEVKIQTLLKGVVNLLDIAKGIKYANLFKSVDILATLMAYADKIDTIALIVDILCISRTVIKKKNLLTSYIGEAVPEIVWMVVVLGKFYKFLNQNLGDLMSYQTQSDDLFTKLGGLDFLSSFFLMPQLVDESRLSNLDLKKVEIIFGDAETLQKKDFFIFKIFKMLFKAWNMDVYSRLDFLSVSLKSISLYSLIDKEPFVKNELDKLWKFNTYLKLELSWDQVKYYLSVSANTDFYCTVIRSKWNEISLESFNNTELESMKKILRLLLMNANSENTKRRRASLGPARKHSADELEKILVDIEDSQIDQNLKVKLIIPKNQVLIYELVNAAKACFMYEDRHGQKDELALDYCKIMDLVSSLLHGLKMDEEVLKFCPGLIGSMLELLRLDIGSESTCLSKVLDLAEDFLIKKRGKYLSDRGEVKDLSDELFEEIIVDLFEAIDSLFVEPSKSYYQSSLGQYSRTICKHSIWQQIVKIDKSRHHVVDAVIVLLDDVLAELPENHLNQTLEQFLTDGLLETVITHYLEVDKMDFETSGFYLLFFCKYLTYPQQPADFDQKLKKCLNKAFQTINNREYIKQNVVRFQGADSTNAVVVLADEIIDLVNVKFSLKQDMTNEMDSYLTETAEFYTQLGIELPKIIRNSICKAIGSSSANQSRNSIPINNQFLMKCGWNFDRPFEEEIYFLDKQAHNMMKFVTKLYDVHRTNLHDEFVAINCSKRFINLMLDLPLQDLPFQKLKNFFSQSFSTVLLQQTNYKHRREVIEICLEILPVKVSEFNNIWASSIKGTQVEDRLGEYFFSRPHKQPSLSLFVSLISQDLQADLKIIKSVTDAIKCYNGVALLMELLRYIFDFQLFIQDDQEMQLFHALSSSKHFKGLTMSVIEMLINSYRGFIEMESNLIQTKTKWFYDRILSWENGVLSQWGVDKSSIVFDMFSDYSFGSLELFTQETSQKPLERMMRNLHQLNLPKTSEIHKKRVELLENYSFDVGRTLGSFEFSETIFNSSEKNILMESLKISKQVQCFSYLIGSYDSRSVLNQFYESGVLDFCEKAIVFAFNLISFYRQEIILLKSIKEVQHEDESKNKSEKSVKVSSRLNTVKYILETICPKVVYCWGILSSFLEFEKNEQVDGVFSSPNIGQLYLQIFNIREQVKKGIFDMARLRAIKALNLIFSNLSGDLNDIMDGELIYSPKMQQLLNTSRIVNSEGIRESVDHKDGNIQSDPEIMVTLKNVANGYDTLKHIHNFIKNSIFKSVDLIPLIARFYQSITNEETSEIPGSMQAESNQNEELGDRTQVASLQIGEMELEIPPVSESEIDPQQMEIEFPSTPQRVPLITSNLGVRNYGQNHTPFTENVTEEHPDRVRISDFNINSIIHYDNLMSAERKKTQRLTVEELIRANPQLSKGKLSSSELKSQIKSEVFRMIDCFYAKLPVFCSINGDFQLTLSEKLKSFDFINLKKLVMKLSALSFQNLVKIHASLIQKKRKAEKSEKKGHKTKTYSAQQKETHTKKSFTPVVLQAFEYSDISIWSNIQVYSVILRMCSRVSTENDFDLDFTKECVFISGFLCDLMKCVYKLLKLVKDDPERWQIFYKYYELTLVSLLRSVQYIYESATKQKNRHSQATVVASNEAPEKTEEPQTDGIQNKDTTAAIPKIEKPTLEVLDDMVHHLITLTHKFATFQQPFLEKKVNNISAMLIGEILEFWGRALLHQLEQNQDSHDELGTSIQSRSSLRAFFLTGNALKNILSMRVFQRTETEFQVSQIRSFFAFIDLLVRDQHLVELCVEQEIRYFFYYKDKQLLEKLNQSKEAKQTHPSTEHRVDSESVGENKDGEKYPVKERKFENLCVNRPELAKIQENFRRVSLEDFNEAFKILSQTQPKYFVDVVRRICILHKHADVTYITLKDQLKYSTEVSEISQETLSVVQRVIKEILRQTNDIICAKDTVESMKQKTELGIPENFIQLSLLMNCFGIIILRRYSVLMPFILKFNIIKVIKTLSQHETMLAYLFASKKDENPHSGQQLQMPFDDESTQVNFIQFYAKILLLIDPKNFDITMTDLADDSAFLVLNKNSGTLYPISSDVRALLISEMISNISSTQDRVIYILNSKLAKFEWSIGQEDHLVLRNFMSSCQNLVYMSYYVKGIKTEQNPRGELNPSKIIKVLDKIYQRLSNEAMSVHFDFCKQIQNILSYFIRLNFLFSANQKLIAKYCETFNLDNPSKAKNLHEVMLNDFPSFRSKFPVKEPEFRPAKILLKKRQTNNDFEKTMLAKGDKSKLDQAKRKHTRSLYQQSESSSSDSNSQDSEEEEGSEEDDDEEDGDESDGGMMDELVEIRFENEQGQQQFIQNLGDIDNLSLGNNRLIIVRENHSFIDPIENDPILSSHISVGNNLGLEDWGSQFGEEEEEQQEENSQESDSDENQRYMDGSEEHYQNFEQEQGESENDDGDGEEEEEYMAQGDENPLVGIERIVPTIRNMIPDDQFEQYLDQLQEDLNMDEEALDLQHERDLIRHLEDENLIETDYDDQEEHGRFSRQVKNDELINSSKNGKTAVLDDLFRKLMNRYPYKGKIDTVGNLTITLHDNLSQFEMQIFSVEFDRIMENFKENPVLTKMSRTIQENSRVRLLMWGIIHENLFGNTKDKKARDVEDPRSIFGNQRWQPFNFGGQDPVGDFDGGLRFENFLNARRGAISRGIDDLSIFDLLRNERNINSITIRRDAESSQDEEDGGNESEGESQGSGSRSANQRSDYDQVYDDGSQGNSDSQDGHSQGRERNHARGTEISPAAFFDRLRNLNTNPPQGDEHRLPLDRQQNFRTIIDRSVDQITNMLRNINPNLGPMSISINIQNPGQPLAQPGEDQNNRIDASRANPDQQLNQNDINDMQSKAATEDVNKNMITKDDDSETLIIEKLLRDMETIVHDSNSPGFSPEAEKKHFITSKAKNQNGKRKNKKIPSKSELKKNSTVEVSGLKLSSNKRNTDTILDNLKIPGEEIGHVPFSFSALGLPEDFLEKQGINSIFFDFLSLDQKIQTIANFLPFEEENAFLKKVEKWKLMTGNGLLGLWKDVFEQNEDTDEHGDSQNPDFYESADEQLEEEQMDDDEFGEEEELEDYNDEEEQDEEDHDGEEEDYEGYEIDADDEFGIRVMSSNPQENSFLLDLVEGSLRPHQIDTEENSRNSRDNIVEPQSREIVGQPEILSTANHGAPRADISLENVAFLDSLTPDLRAEILLTCQDDFLETLTVDMREEARRLREDFGFDFRHHEHFNPQIIRSEDAPREISETENDDNLRIRRFGFNPLRGQEDEEEEQQSEEDADEDDGMALEALSRKDKFKAKNQKFFDDETMMKNNKLEDSVIRQAIKSLYSTSDTDQINIRFLSVICSNYYNEAKLFDTFLFILEHPAIGDQLKALGFSKDLAFPPHEVFELPEIHKCPKKSYSYISGKIIEIMIGLVSDHMNFFDVQKLKSLVTDQSLDEGNATESKNQLLSLGEIARLKIEFGADPNESPICRLIRLLSFDEIKTDEYVMPRLLQLILKVIKSLVAKNVLQQTSPSKTIKEGSKFETSFDPSYSLIQVQAEIIDDICRILTSSIVKPESLVLLPEIISLLCLNKRNLENFVNLMNSTVKALGKSLCKWAHNHLIILKEANDRKMLNDSEFLELWNIKEENEVAFSRNLSLIKQSSSDLRRSQSQTQELFTNFDNQVGLEDEYGQEGERLLKVFKMINELFAKYYETQDKNSQEKNNQSSINPITGTAMAEIIETTNTEVEEVDIQDCQMAEEASTLLNHQNSVVETPKKAEKHENPANEQQKPIFDDQIKSEVRQKFANILEDKGLMHFWIDLMEIMRILGGGEDDTTLKNYEEFVVKLKPLTECFFISFKILGDDEYLTSIRTKYAKNKLKKSAIKTRFKGEIATFDMTEEQPEEQLIQELQMLKSDNEITITRLFQTMCEVNKSFLNFLIEQDSKLLNGSFSCIAKNMSKIISFKNKRAYFKQEVKKDMGKKRPGLRFSVRRNEIFMDSFNHIMNKNPGQLKGKLWVKFQGEDGEDAGGVSREWFLNLSKEVFNENYALFKNSDNQTTFQPNPNSGIDPQHCKYFRFVGRIVGKVRKYFFVTHLEGAL